MKYWHVNLDNQVYSFKTNTFDHENKTIKKIHIAFGSCTTDWTLDYFMPKR